MVKYGSVGCPVLGPYEKNLSDNGEKLEISKPGDEKAGIRYYIRMDRVNYSDGSQHEDFDSNDPWPIADGRQLAKPDCRPLLRQ